MPDLSRPLRETFGHQTFRVGQREIIDRVLQDQRVLAILPTGGGKSLTYQLPALLLEGLTLVISPLLALMKDQVDSLRSRGIRAARLDSTLPLAEQVAVLKAATSGQLDLLYLSPERLAQTETFEALKQAEIALFVIDEVHCYTEWGHSFRPDYLRLPGLARRLKPRSVLCLTATATPAAAREIRRAFGIKAAATVVTPFTRPNLAYHVVPLEAEQRFPALLERLSTPGSQPAIVYTIRQETAVDLAGRLAAAGIPARSYHAGMDTAGREHVQQAFLAGEVPVIVATIAFGMGVDKANVRRVIHYNLPKSLEGWLQESGRAGRDGADAVAEVFACAEDIPVLENFATAWLPGAVSLERLLKQIFETDTVSLFDLSSTFDLRRETLEHLLVRLELDGWIQVTGRTWKRTRLSPLRPPATLIATLPRSLRKEATALLNGNGALDLLTLAAEANVALPKLHRVLDEWETAGDARVIRWHRLLEVRVRQRPTSIKELSKNYWKLLESQSEGALARLQSVTKMLTFQGCLTRALLAYFGERRSPQCGRCSSCLKSPPPRRLPGKMPSEPEELELAAIGMLVRERHVALQAPIQLARFLCGLRSPAASRKRLERHPVFGRLERLPISTVLAYAEVALGVSSRRSGP